MGIKAKSKTKKGQAQFDMDMLETLSKTHAWAENLRIYNKLLKIKSTYVDRFIDRSENGRYYFYFKQHGTVSGRYGSDAQQLPKPKEEGEDAPIIVKYTNIVRAFLTAGEGRKVIDSDYESLEPHCFASVTKDKNLQDIFNNGWDFYSTVAIKTEKLEQDTRKYPDGVSPDRSSPVFLKKLDPVKRNTAKGYALGVPYGMGAFALGKTLDVPQKEAERLINGYLDGFPQLKDWMESSREQVKAHGYIVNHVGRVRHLPKVKRIYEKFGDKILDWKFRNSLNAQYGKDAVLQVYRDYKNGLNNCLNYQLQSLAASVVNRAALKINRKAKEMGIDAIVQAQVHDQLVINIREDQAEEFAPIVQHIMETNLVLPGVTLKAPPEIANNWKEGH
jgi:DNA polymerase-1